MEKPNHYQLKLLKKIRKPLVPASRPHKVKGAYQRKGKFGNSWDY